jgi:tetratricopeptide (TPR) repeat protein
MERRINKKIDNWITEFKDEIKEKALELGLVKDQNMTQLVQYIFDYERLALIKDDFMKRKRVKNSVILSDRLLSQQSNDVFNSNKKSTSWIIFDKIISSSFLEYEKCNDTNSKIKLDKKNDDQTSLYLSNCKPSFSSSHLFNNNIIDQSTASNLIRQLQALLKIENDIPKTEIESDIMIQIGILMWCVGGKLRNDKLGCIHFLLTGAKLDPTHLKVFSYIGHYYLTIANDFLRAEKCYLKALVISGNLDREAGIGLSYLYLQQQQQDIKNSSIENSNSTLFENKAVNLWLAIQQQTTYASWTNFLYGSFLINDKKYEEAVSCFQLVLELDPQDASAWHGLGFSYERMSQLKSAHKSFESALALCPNDLILQTTIADIERRLCVLPESLDRFQHVLSMCGRKDITGLKGSADVCLLLAYQRLSFGWIPGAARIICLGIQAAKEALFLLEQTQNILSVNESIAVCATSLLSPCTLSLPSSSETVKLGLKRCLWKVLGDLCSFVGYLSPSDIAHAYMQFQTCKSSVGRPSLLASSSNVVTLNYSTSLSSSESINVSCGFGVVEPLTSYDILIDILKEGERAYQSIVDSYDHNNKSILLEYNVDGHKNEKNKHEEDIKTSFVIAM